MKLRFGEKVLSYITALVICLFAIFPFIWMVSVSFKPPSEVYAQPTLLPKAATLQGYKTLLFEKSPSFNFGSWVKNSAVVSIITTLFSLVIGTLGGYGISRYMFRGKRLLSYSILTTQVIPGSLLLIPLYVIMGGLNLLDSLFGLALAYTTFSVPFCTWMMKGYFDTIPRSIDEAARVDGANRFKVFSEVVLPLTIPGLVASGIFAFISGWNEYLFSSIFIRTNTKWTLSVGVSSFQGQYDTNWGSMMAGSVMIAIPVVIIFLFLQKHLVSGMTSGAVKG